MSLIDDARRVVGGLALQFGVRCFPDRDEADTRLKLAVADAWLRERVGRAGTRSDPAGRQALAEARAMLAATGAALARPRATIAEQVQAHVVDVAAELGVELALERIETDVAAGGFVVQVRVDQRLDGQAIADAFLSRGIRLELPLERVRVRAPEVVPTTADAGHA